MSFRLRTSIIPGACLVTLAIFSVTAYAAETERGVMVREAIIYLAPDSSSSKLGTVERGRELAVLEKSRTWVHVLASVTSERDVTGWILDKGVVRKSTPNGDQILFGQAVDSEAEASRRRGRRGAADEAQRLYARTAEYFPNSPLAGEALYRSADIKWQLQRAEMLARPSAKQRDPMLRMQIEEDQMKEVIKKYPRTKWADLAAFHLIENKVCGDWEGRSKCPEKESDMYEKYAAEHPQSPLAAEALYNAATRQAALIDIYRTEEQPKKSAEAKDRTLRLSQQIVGQYEKSDWAPRARALAYLVEQGIPTYGNTTE